MNSTAPLKGSPDPDKVWFAIALTLPPHRQELASCQIANGKYTSLDEILLAGLQALAVREEIYQVV
jgi:hypothetical protein